ncbi:MerR family transcriptional regulator, partial [Deltaproteobacteria bacterium OttesenSCG-928-K17]|nr:MerR family transcriptional regulator [Deltaproteobacteria bacterium OttesenSCG-928-K17]
MNFRIGEVADIAGCQVVTIRYYEKRGLLGKPTRSDGNFRLYEDKDVRRVKFIRLCRENEMPLAEIKMLLNAMDDESSGPTQIKAILEQRLQSIDEQMHSLARLKSLLEHLKPALTKEDGQMLAPHQINQAAAEFCMHCQATDQRGKS